jgi:STE24 endopeptidase
MASLLGVMVVAVAVGVVVLRLLAELALSRLNRREVERNAAKAPAAVAAIMDEPTYQKSVAYTLAKNRFGQVELVWDVLVLLVVLFSGVLPWLYEKFAGLSPEGSWDDALFLIATGLLMGIPSLPLEWWGQFRLEQRFGFNKSTLGLWISDKIKGGILALLLGLPILWALLSLVGKLGDTWWIWGFVLVFCYQLLMVVLEPRIIRPWFNKLTPLPDGELRDRLMALADRTGFKASTIQVMDGSKRSGHSNAFFTGFGRFRRIVLYDTLVNQLTPEELEAVLAHEVGHYKCGHIPKMLIVSALMQFGMFAAIAALMKTTWFNPAFGLPPGELAPTLLLFSLLSAPVLFWLTPLGNLVSRKHEYEADAFARNAMRGPAALVSALRKLAEKNLSNLTPHPWFSSFYYSHPTLVERERALLKGA